MKVVPACWKSTAATFGCQNYRIKATFLWAGVTSTIRFHEGGGGLMHELGLILGG